MDVRQLTYFLAIVDHGGFGRAAEHLLVAQPSLSQAMAALERELAVPLFRRAGRGVTLTDPGERLVGPARRVVRDMEAVREAARATAELQGGRVDLVTMPSPGIEPLTTLIGRFTSQHPAMSVNVRGVFTPEETVQTVRSGVAEIGILGAADRLNTADLTVIDIEEQPLVLISAPDSGLPREPHIDRARIAGRRLIVSQRGSLMRQLVDDILVSGVDVQVVAEIAHRTSILPSVLAGLGDAVMPSSWTGLARRAGAEVRRIEPTSILRVSAVMRIDALTPGAQRFATTIARYSEEVRHGEEKG